MQEILLALGQRMCALRKVKGNISQEAFADLCGLHRTAVSLIERGKRVPSLKTLVVIADGFDVTLCVLLRGVDEGRRKRRHKAAS
jgi:transcriptional regulator with XRE-family HTH domain